MAEAVKAAMAEATATVVEAEVPEEQGPCGDLARAEALKQRSSIASTCLYLYWVHMTNEAHSLNSFLGAIEGRAYYMARLGTRNDADALDIIQDCMSRFVKCYSKKPANEWKPLFYRVLHNRIADWHRREFVRSRLSLFSEVLGIGRREASAEVVYDPPDPNEASAEDAAATNMFVKALGSALTMLPLRQRQTFLMRAWEGMSVTETALTLNCSEGSVKKHYSRALKTLKTQLEGYKP